MHPLYLAALPIAFSFVFWPILGKWSGASGAWISSLVLLGSLTTGVLFSLRELTTGPLPNLKSLLYLGIAGLMNGIAVYYYTTIAVNPQIKTGVFVVAVTVGMTIIGMLLDWIMNGGAPTLRQWVGVLAVVLGIFLLAK